METENSITGGSFAAGVLQVGSLSLDKPATRPSGLPPRGLFVGREPLLADLVTELATGEGPLLVSALAGLGGIGKTALAVEAAHRTRHLFPGGTLFVDLRGYDEHPVAPEQALDTLLRALGEDLPPEDPAAKQHRYRTLLAAADGPLLLIADNASSPAQVTPLLPGDPRHRVLVTSRHVLSDRTLTPHHFRVGTLDEDESVALLTELSGHPDPAFTEVARLCGHLPLALRVAGALLTDRTPAELATDLTDTRERLTELDYGPDLTVRTAFDLSHHHLAPAEARLFALLGRHPGPDLALDAATALADLPERETLRLLRSLTRAHLVEAADRRYRLHDLVKLYAAERPADDAEQGMVRLARFYAAVAATIEPNLRARGEWISAEGENVFATHHAVGFGLDPHVSAALDDGITWYLLQSAVFRAIAVGNVGAARGSAPHREDLTEMIRIESVDDLFTSSASLPRGPELSSLLVLLKELTANAAQPELTPDVLPEYFRLLSDGLCRFRAGAERMGGLLGPQEAELRELEEQLTDMAKGATGGR
ncbi:NB-ARC domain-containing protein [Kitasatospora sp. NRRL B-11411]|uniref:NB-ARC domain-containing protein n=1 Tax=Kitasatospora sp. NRRL B-11411 TaxID=1463822 RepID=UPI00068F2BA9|nr:NB-ARC domain-containing protein [Kitasatospora sp. NRRL B-11411]